MPWGSVQYGRPSQKRNTVCDAPRQFGRFFLVVHADDTGVRDVQVLKKERLEFRGRHCNKNVSAPKKDVLIAMRTNLPWKP